MDANYYFCSQAVVDQFKPEQVSKPFKSGFQIDGYTPHYVAWLNWDEVKKHYDEVVVPNKEKDYDAYSNFWAQELVPGQMYVKDIDLEQAKLFGLLWEIELKTGLTKTNNQAMTIYNLTEREGLNPIDLINKIA
ncbi:hypothetical protein [Flavobacterium sp. CF136]|uniref:hypothetical protein n=1 Tax=Flavobacterium sp. (strain CF136) TaxID=1144313 RepID=UPI0002719F01|nr:hypothetical protein [Flavobacterium sp. CF136]EJL66287.1 hypothetical protein PMI10_00635 [Flavobacterium sp. CF136]